jgi:hypothetical protein
MATIKYLCALTIVITTGCAGLIEQSTRQSFYATQGYCHAPGGVQVYDIQTSSDLHESGRRYTARCGDQTYRCVDLIIRNDAEVAVAVLGGGESGTPVRSCELVTP